jgi:hypothetical protein
MAIDPLYIADWWKAVGPIFLTLVGCGLVIYMAVSHNVDAGILAVAAGMMGGGSAWGIDRLAKRGNSE